MSEKENQMGGKKSQSFLEVSRLRPYRSASCSSGNMPKLQGKMRIQGCDMLHP